MTMPERLVQPEKQDEGKDVSEDGRPMLFRPVHQEKHPFPNDVTEDGRSMSVRLEQFRKQ